MAQKRMFSVKVVETDRFLEMPTSAQCLYFHLGMYGDDDGFVASPRRITAMCGCNPDDLKLLCSKGFVYPFSSGVCVIMDWRINNTLKNDRYIPTIYEAEKTELLTVFPDWFQPGSKMVPQHNVTKRNLTQHNETKHNGGGALSEVLQEKKEAEATFDEMRQAAMQKLQQFQP